MITEKPHTGLDECPRILLSCLRARNSDKVADEDEEEGGDTAVEEVHGVEKEESVADVDEIKEEEEEVVDIDLDDPEVEAAATKIQGGPTGFYTGNGRILLGGAATCSKGFVICF